MNYYPEPDSYGRKEIKVELDLYNYATKYELKKATDVDLASLKLIVDELNIDS